MDKTLRRQTVHRIGAYFSVSMFLDSREKSLNMLSYVGNKKKFERTKKNEVSVLVAESQYKSQNAQFGLVMKPWPIFCFKKIYFGI